MRFRFITFNILLYYASRCIVQPVGATLSTCTCRTSYTRSPSLTLCVVARPQVRRGRTRGINSERVAVRKRACGVIAVLGRSPALLVVQHCANPIGARPVCGWRPPREVLAVAALGQMERVAAYEAPRGENQSLQRRILPEGQLSILGARGYEAAAWRDQWRDEPLVEFERRHRGARHRAPSVLGARCEQRDSATTPARAGERQRELPNRRRGCSRRS